MLLLFDLQKQLENPIDYIQPCGSQPPSITVEASDGVKFIHVTNRTDAIAGVEIKLDALFAMAHGAAHSIQQDDRITITGRIGKGAPRNDWGIALTSNVDNEETQLTQHVSPEDLYSLSYKFYGTETIQSLFVTTTKWRSAEPLMDFTIDSIRITRMQNDYVSQLDIRNMVYSLAHDREAHHLAATNEFLLDRTSFLCRSGEGRILMLKEDENVEIHVLDRTLDYDGIDILLTPLKLLKGNEYSIRVTGIVDESADHIDPTARIMLQGLPGFLWRSTQPMGTDEPFVLSHSISKSAIDEWEAIRITTNKAGANIPFHINTIEIMRCGKNG